MPITNVFREAVRSEDILAIRIMMKNRLYLDPTFREFEEMDRIASSVPGLYVPYDKGPLNMNTAEWTKDYMITQLVELVDNFSKERVAHLKQVIRHLYPTDEAQNQEDQSLPYEERKRRSQADGSYAGAVFGAGIGAGAGCVAGVVGGVVAGHLLAGLAVGAAVGAAIGGYIGFYGGGRS